MPRVIVDVMPKPEILDPQGKAVHGALPRLGFARVSDVRQGKRFELEVEQTDEATLAEIDRIAETLLSNPVIEDYAVHVDPAPSPTSSSEPATSPSEPATSPSEPSAPSSEPVEEPTDRQADA